MSENAGKRSYSGSGITVTFEAALCRHAAECVSGLPEVFDTARRPWIQPDRAASDRVAEVVRRCPSGALAYRQPAAGAAPGPDADPAARPGGGGDTDRD